MRRYAQRRRAAARWAALGPFTPAPDARHEAPLCLLMADISLRFLKLTFERGPGCGALAGCTVATLASSVRPPAQRCPSDLHQRCRHLATAG